MTYQQVFAAPDGTELVVIPKAEYDRLMALPDDIAEIAAADRARVDPARYPAEVVDAMLGGISPLAAWRAFRQMSQAELAKAAGISQAGVSSLERSVNGKTRFGWRSTREALARALDIPVSALDPFED